jgi:hypothetical protein
MSPTDARSQVNEILEQLDDEDVQALHEMVDESPELLRQTLTEYGFLEEDSSDDGMITNRDTSVLSSAQQDLRKALSGELQEPKPIDEIVETVGAEDAEFRQQYRSAQYRSWVSEQLKALAEEGEVGRYGDGRKIYYTETPELAVKHWTRLNERFIDDISMADANKISDETGMPKRIIREVLTSLKQ